MSSVPVSYSARCFLWHRWGLHCHIPRFFGYDDGSISNQQIVELLTEDGVRAVAITDPWSLSIVWTERTFDL